MSTKLGDFSFWGFADQSHRAFRWQVSIPETGLKPAPGRREGHRDALLAARWRRGADLWRQLKPGSLVLAAGFDKDDNLDGWWEAIIVRVDDGEFLSVGRDTPTSPGPAAARNILPFFTRKSLAYDLRDRVSLIFDRKLKLELCASIGEAICELSTPLFVSKEGDADGILNGGGVQRILPACGSWSFESCSFL